MPVAAAGKLVSLPFFAALSDDHTSDAHSIERFLARNEHTSDKRILMQLEDVRAAIQDVIKETSARRENA
jgi:hypothetical protein